MKRYVIRPNIDLHTGIKVTKDTEIEYKNDNVEQTLKDLVFCSKTTVKGDNFESVYNTTINLNEGDVLIFEEEGRGYIKPVADFVSIEEAIDDLTNIKDLG